MPRKRSNAFAFLLSALFILLAGIQAVNMWRERSAPERVQLSFMNNIPEHCNFAGSEVLGKKIADYLRDLNQQKEAVRPIIAITYDRVDMVVAVNNLDIKTINHIHYLLANSIVQGTDESCYSEKELQNMLKRDDKKSPMHFIESSKVENNLSLLNYFSLMFNLVIAYVIYRMRPTA